ncbi:hypothetical protein Franean1_3536 [Parafrankia sp. EAN1pec]|nr:hypothetical protein Franean1_3536 [Frankia sp. EAN1pec]
MVSTASIRAISNGAGGRATRPLNRQHPTPGSGTRRHPNRQRAVHAAHTRPSSRTNTLLEPIRSSRPSQARSGLTAEVRRVTDLGAAVLTGVRSARTAGHGTSWRIRTATSSALWPRPTPTGRLCCPIAGR